MKKVYNIILALLIIAALVIVVIIATEYIKRAKNEDTMSAVVEQIEDIGSNSNIKEKTLKIKGLDYEVEGIIEIPKINIKYPIVSDSSDEAMKVAIIKYWGKDINGLGNYSIAGHNYKNGTMFGKTKYLEVGDRIKLTDLNLNTIEYEIYDKFITDPNDVTILETTDETVREVTLITCTNGHNNRLIIKAKEVF